MPYTASLLYRDGGSWAGADVDLAEVEDLDELADLMRETADTAPLSLLFVDEDDEFLAVVRVDGEGEPRVFVSDRRALEGVGVVSRLLADSAVVEEVVEPDEDDESGPPAVEPAGETGVLGDVGVGSDALLELCAEEGMLPFDVVFAICEKVGCSEVLEGVRGL